MTGSRYTRLSQDIVKLFKNELWKDQRQLDTFQRGAETYMLKHFDTPSEAELEVRLLNHLASTLAVAKVPEPATVVGNAACFPYIRGIRVFNLLVELDRLTPPLADRGASLKRAIIRRCEDRQRDIQRSLVAFRRGSGTNPYPAGQKILSIVQILSAALGIVVSWESLEAELFRIDEIWMPEANVPFRDASTKNMVLAAKELWLGLFESEEARYHSLVESLGAENEPSWLEAPIVDFDFSSCVNDSTPEDDPISLKFFERSWTGPPRDSADLVWDYAPNPIRAAVTFIVRYYRFGGRKAAYRLIHPSGHRIRFRHDRDSFYFQRLPAIVRRLWPESDGAIPELLTFTETVGRTLDDVRAEVDLFSAAGFGEKRRYYVDMYPE